MGSNPSILKRIWGWITWPYRVWRERISVQMIISYLAMVLLVMILFEATVLGSILLNPGDRFFAPQQVTIDPYLGERSAAYVQWLDPDRIEASRRLSRVEMRQYCRGHRLRHLRTARRRQLDDGVIGRRVQVGEHPRCA